MIMKNLLLLKYFVTSLLKSIKEIRLMQLLSKDTRLIKMEEFLNYNNHMSSQIIN